MTNSSSYLDGWLAFSRQKSEDKNTKSLSYSQAVYQAMRKKGEQLEIFEPPQSELDVSDHLVEIVSDTEPKIKPELIQPEPKEPPPGAVNLYFPGKRNTPYYRFSYRRGRRTKHKHIRGGNYANSKAQANADTIRDMVKRRVALGEILAQIAKF